MGLVSCASRNFESGDSGIFIMIYWVYRILLGATGWVPRRLGYGLARLLSYIFYVFDRRARKAVWSNLRVAMAERGDRYELLSLWIPPTGHTQAARDRPVQTPAATLASTAASTAMWTAPSPTGAART